MVIRFKIILIILLLITPTILMGHKVTLEDKSLEEIVNNRMALMQKVKSTSSQIFRLLKTNDYEAILELNDKFVSDIEMISLSAELEDSEMLNDAFKVMSANCGACHKKFRN